MARRSSRQAAGRRNPKPLLPKRRDRAAAEARGSLADAFGAGAPSDANGLARVVRVSEVRPNPVQPRQRIDADGLDRLADSIRAHGVLQPPLVRERGNGYELIAGERRWRAAQRAGLEEIPVLVRPASGAEQLELALIENVAREDITPIEEARSLAALIDDLGVTQSDLGSRLGMSQADISHTMRLLELPDEALGLIDDGTLTKGHGKALLGERKRERRMELARRAAAEGWSVRKLGGVIAAERGRTATDRRRGRRPTSAKQREAAKQLAAQLAGRLPARSVKAAPRGKGVAIEIVTETVDDANAIVDRLVSKRRRA